jgi:peptide/nickel transport system substrate-binding protein
MTPPDTLVMGKAIDITTLDPAFTQDSNDFTVIYPCYQRLMKYKVEKGMGTTELEGDLAESWAVSKDNLVWDFKLRKGQKFDDGTPVDANAVKASFERLVRIGKGPSEIFTDIKVSVVEPMVVRFTMTKVFAPFLAELTVDGTSIVNTKALDKPDAGVDGQAFLSRNTAGSGPFHLVSWTKGQSLVLEPNPYYAGNKPVLKKVVVRFIPEDSSRRMQLENGDLDLAEALSDDQLVPLRTMPAIHVADFQGLNVTYLYLNNKRAPLDNVQVRQAISYAIDYNGIIKDIRKNQVKQMHGAIPEGMWGHDPTVMQYQLDLPKAKALLAQANPTRRKIGFLYSNRDPYWEPIGLTVQANLAGLGLDVKMESMANATMRDRLDKGDFDIAIGNWSPDYGDPYQFMNYWFETSRYGLAGNRSFYTNPEVDKMLLEAGSISDLKRRSDIYKKAQKIVVDEASYVFLYQRKYHVAMRSGVKGFVYNPMLDQIFNLDSMTKN